MFEQIRTTDNIDWHIQNVSHSLIIEQIRTTDKIGQKYAAGCEFFCSIWADQNYWQDQLNIHQDVSCTLIFKQIRTTDKIGQ